MGDDMDIDDQSYLEELDNQSVSSYRSNHSNMTTNSNKSQQIPTNGNYRGYYKFREKQMTDNFARVAGFQSSWFYEQRVLDIGCNDGTLTMMVAKDFNPMSVIGVDIDQRLIDAAGSAVKRAKYEYRLKKKCDRINTLEAIPETIEANHNTPIKQSHAFIPRQVAKIRQLYPGQILSSSPTDDNGGKYPFNVFFRCEDVMDSMTKIEEHGYGVILCMSVAKWVHLNHGDDGLMKFFHLLFSMTTPGGKVIVEYQPWKSYINNKAASETIKCNFKQIKIRPDDFERILSEEIGFTIISRLGTSLDKAKGFQRPIVVLMKPLPQIARISWHVSRSHDNQANEITDAMTDNNQHHNNNHHNSNNMEEISPPAVHTHNHDAANASNTGAASDIFGVKRRISLSADQQHHHQDDASPNIAATKRYRVDWK